MSSLYRHVLRPGESPRPNNLLILPDGTHTTVIATVIYSEDEDLGAEFHTLVLMAPKPPYFRVVEYGTKTQTIEYIETFANLVDAINGETFPEVKAGFVQRGGDR